MKAKLNHAAREECMLEKLPNNCALCLTHLFTWDISKEGMRDVEPEEKLGDFLGVGWRPGVSSEVEHVVCEGEFPLPGHLMMSGDSCGLSRISGGEREMILASSG